MFFHFQGHPHLQGDPALISQATNSQTANIVWALQVAPSLVSTDNTDSMPFTHLLINVSETIIYIKIKNLPGL